MTTTEDIQDQSIQADGNTVPPECRCPVCGKWGRRSGMYASIQDNRQASILYCNPRSIRGGKGCGEYFRVITPDKSACAVTVPKWRDMAAEFDNRPLPERMIDLGHEAIRRLKAAGLHDGTIRNTTWDMVYHVFYKSFSLSPVPTEGENYACGCGCGRVTKRAKDEFATSECKDAVYGVSELIANPGKKLTYFICTHVNHSTACQKCGADTGRHDDLELDHIIEVKEGGGMCWLDNFQVLCRQCHKEKTAKYAALRAERRRLASEADDPQLSLF